MSEVIANYKGYDVFAERDHLGGNVTHICKAVVDGKELEAEENTQYGALHELENLIDDELFYMEPNNSNQN